MLRSTRRLRSCLRRCLRRGVSGHAEPVLTAISPERLVGSFERRCGASTRGPHALDRVARPQPGCDLVLSLKEAGVRFVTRRLCRCVVRARLWFHRPSYRFWGPKVFSDEAFFFDDRAERSWKRLRSPGSRWSSLQRCESRRYRLELGDTDLGQIAASYGQSRRKISLHS